jgi:hypothetical protein
MFARLIFSIVEFGARKGLNNPNPAAAKPDAANSVKQRARRTGVRGETYAYWYLRRHGYILVARNFTSPGIKGEIDMVGYDVPSSPLSRSKREQLFRQPMVLCSHCNPPRRMP